MIKKEDIILNFKTAIASTIKSLSKKENVEVVFGNEKNNEQTDVIFLPDLNKENKINFLKIRALADSESLKLRLSDTKIYKVVV